MLEGEKLISLPSCDQETTCDCVRANERTLQTAAVNRLATDETEDAELVRTRHFSPEVSALL